SWSVSNPHGVILPSEPWRRRAAYLAGDRCPRSVHLAGLLRLERVDQPLEGRQGGGDRAGVLFRELVEDRLEPVAPGGHAPMAPGGGVVGQLEAGAATAPRTLLAPQHDGSDERAAQPGDGAGAQPQGTGDRAGPRARMGGDEADHD